MKRNRKITILSSTLCLVMLLGQSCEKWLDLGEFNKIPLNEFWQTKEDVDGMTAGAYLKFQQSISKVFIWSELRGDGVTINKAWDKDAAWLKNYYQFKELEIKEDNAFVKYDDMYNVINRCNQVIAYGPTVLELDETFTKKECDLWVAEMKWLRSLCYFYLVRTFKDVPYVTEPYMDDTKPFAVAKTDGNEIMRKLIDELALLGRPHESGGTPPEGTLPPTHPGGGWKNKGRATTYAAYALMADIYLWLGDEDEEGKDDYENAIDYCDKIINSGQYSLIETYYTDAVSGEVVYTNDNWYKQLFAIGNSTESIFEVQWTKTHDQTNPLFSWFLNYDGNVRRLIVPSAIDDLFEAQTQNVRGNESRSYTKDYEIWKYCGTDVGGGNTRPDGQRNANYILYRLADIYLMKAEALIMQGAGNYAEAFEIINMISKRGGFHNELPIFSTEKDAINYLLEERQREFIGEGKRWFDIVRVAVRDDAKYKDILIELLVADIPAKDRESYRSKLNTRVPYGYYLPLHEDEVSSSGGVLTQNIYYQR